MVKIKFISDYKSAVVSADSFENFHITKVRANITSVVETPDRKIVYVTPSVSKPTLKQIHNVQVRIIIFYICKFIFIK